MPEFSAEVFAKRLQFESNLVRQWYRMIGLALAGFSIFEDLLCVGRYSVVSLTVLKRRFIESLIYDLDLNIVSNWNILIPTSLLVSHCHKRLPINKPKRANSVPNHLKRFLQDIHHQGDTSRRHGTPTARNLSLSGRRNGLAGQFAGFNRIKMLHRAIHRKAFRSLGKSRGKVLRNYIIQKGKVKLLKKTSRPSKMFTIPFVQHEPGIVRTLWRLALFTSCGPGNCYSEPRIYIIHQRPVQAWACVMSNVAESEAVPKTKW